MHTNETLDSNTFSASHDPAITGQCSRALDQALPLLSSVVVAFDWSFGNPAACTGTWLQSALSSDGCAPGGCMDAFTTLGSDGADGTATLSVEGGPQTSFHLEFVHQGPCSQPVTWAVRAT